VYTSIAVPNHASSVALPNAAQRTPTPAISATASVVSAIVADQARTGIMKRGAHAFNSAVRSMKRSKASQRT
jgi:hypothetical protein